MAQGQFVVSGGTQKKFTDREVIVDISPVDFDNQIDYEDAMQLLSVALMLRDSASVQRIIKAMDSNRYCDALYENLISGYVDDPQEDFEELMHDKPPYGLLVDMFFEESDAKTLKLLEKYLKNWYKNQDGARWFDGHLDVVDDSAAYYGYWAFEAGVVAYILGLDDSSIDHMVYPIDLVAYGKKLREEDRWTSPDVPVQEQTQRLRVLHGETVPKAGWWYTPALSGGQGMRLFNEGERLPDTAFTSWGEVIWYWEPERQK